MFIYFICCRERITLFLPMIESAFHTIQMNKIILISLLSFIFFPCLHAQTQPQGSISGNIFDATTKQPIPAATIRILHPQDSTLITGVSSKANGSFIVSLQPGAYLAHISFMGYADLFRNATLTPSHPAVLLDTLIMHESHIMLDEAIITGQAPEIVVKGDTLEYNADTYKVTETAVIEDMLKKMTGVEIDNEGVIKVNGKVIKKILVDNKEFFSDDPKVASKNLPAKMIARLQIFDKQSETEKMTGFDDGNEEMVINLTVKPNMKKGLFGNAFAGYGSKERYEANAMVNHMKDRDQMTFMGGVNNTNNAGFSDLASAMFQGMGGGAGRGGRGGGGSGITQSANSGFNISKTLSEKLEMGGNIRYGRSSTEAASKTYTQNFLSKGDNFEAEQDRSVNQSENVNIDLRLEWKPDSLTSLVFTPNASFQRNDRKEEGEFSTTRDNGDTINVGSSNYGSHGSGSSMGGSLHLNRRLGKLGRTITLSVNAGRNVSENMAENLSDTYYNGTRPDDLIDQRITNNNNSTHWNSALSYVEPIGKQHFLQFSYSYRQNRSESDKDTRTQDEEGEYTLFDKKYSKLHENYSTNQDISIQFRSRKEKYNYTVGFNIFPTASTRKTYIGDSLINDFRQKVTNYSPTTQFNYLWTRQKNLRFTYNGNTQFPSVNQLSPVTDITNPLNITYGNPDLKPSFLHRTNIRYQSSQPENNRFYMLSGNFNYTMNDIVTSRFTDQETGRKENTFRNVNGNWDAGIRFTTTQPIINKRFTVTTTTNSNYSRNNGFSNNEENSSRQINLSENLGFNFNSDQILFSIRGNIAYNKVRNSLEGQQDREFFNYGSSAGATIYLPFDCNLQSDIRYSTNSGYADGFKQNETLWNASLEKQLFKQKNGIIRIKVYDLLQQRSNIRRNVSSNFIRDTTTNTLTSYFIVHLVYRFNVFKGGATGSDMRSGGRGNRSPGRQGRG